MKKYILRFGLLAGVILMLEIVITFSLMKRSGNMQGSEVFGYSIMALVLGICMVLAMLRFRKEGPAKIRKGIMLCLGLGVLASFLYVIGWAITYHFIVPDFMDTMMAMMQKQFDAGKISREYWDMTKDMAANYDNPFYFTLYTLMEILPVAVILGLLIPTIMHFALRSTKG